MTRDSRLQVATDPYCAICGDALERTLSFRALEAIGGDTRESITVRVLYCATCGVALGQLPARDS
jgi:hypothetical protein